MKHVALLARLLVAVTLATALLQRAEEGVSFNVSQYDVSWSDVSYPGAEQGSASTSAVAALQRRS